MPGRHVAPRHRAPRSSLTRSVGRATGDLISTIPGTSVTGAVALVGATGVAVGVGASAVEPEDATADRAPTSPPRASELSADVVDRRATTPPSQQVSRSAARAPLKAEQKADKSRHLSVSLQQMKGGVTEKVEAQRPARHRDEHARRLRLEQRPVLLPRLALHARERLEPRRAQPVLRRTRHPAVAARRQDGRLRRRLVHQPRDPARVGPALHPGPLRLPLRRLGLLDQPTTGTDQLASRLAALLLAPGPANAGRLSSCRTRATADFPHFAGGRAKGGSSTGRRGRRRAAPR